MFGGSAKAKRERREGGVRGGGAEPGNGAQAFADKPPARAPEGELARRLPSRRGCPKRRVLKGRSRLGGPRVGAVSFAPAVSNPDLKEKLFGKCEI